MKTSNDIKFIKHTLLSIDAWRDCDNLWNWNAWYELESDIYLPENMSNRALIKFFRDDLNLIDENSKGKVSIDDDGHNITLINKDTHEPLFALCYGMHQ